MTEDKRKVEPALKLDMVFSEALSRFAATDPKEVADSVERSKTKKPPQEGTPRRLTREKYEKLPPTSPKRGPVSG